MSMPEQEKLKLKESETVRNLLKKQNSLLGDSLEALDHLIYLQKSTNLTYCFRDICYPFSHLIWVCVFSYAYFKCLINFVASIYVAIEVDRIPHLFT